MSLLPGQLFRLYTRDASTTVLAVLGWTTLFSIYAYGLKFLLMTKKLPMSEAAKGRGTSREEFAKNVASCIVAITTHLYLGPTALMLSFRYQAGGYPAALSAFLQPAPPVEALENDRLCCQVGELFTGNILYQVIFWLLRWETGFDTLLHHIGFFVAGYLILDLTVFGKLSAGAMSMEVSSVFLSLHLMFRQIDGKLCALVSEAAAAVFALSFILVRIFWYGFIVIDFNYNFWMEPFKLTSDMVVPKAYCACFVFSLGWVLQLYWSQMVVTKAAKAAKAMLS